MNPADAERDRRGEPVFASVDEALRWFRGQLDDARIDANAARAEVARLTVGIGVAELRREVAALRVGLGKDCLGPDLYQRLSALANALATWA